VPEGPERGRRTEQTVNQGVRKQHPEDSPSLSHLLFRFLREVVQIPQETPNSAIV